ncbi:alpha/beta hydrolase fold-domain-containing protein [Plectosphaerella plurivora]|uniref:Alpha/beta hydrolase fold-domain-containing protein n=1 Tax=Plectosphaerella plurivora TaxID=936078 RepID=A0A9P8V8Y1_9PEZI|nr:alpha/beta hydrolase fold-domain-containing protein [Plectosphaerella plurivora]
MASMTGKGDLFDKCVTVEIPKLGEGHVRVSICVPRVTEEQDTASKPLILVAEGGGFVLGQPSDGETNDRMLSDAVNAVVVSVDYAKSPRYPYPHALLQLFEVLLWATGGQLAEVLGFDIDPSRVAVMGNSAGGNLTAALTMLVSFTSGPCATYRKRLPESFKIAAQVLLYPSLACNRPYLERYSSSDDAVRAASLPVSVASLMEDAYLPPYIDQNQVFIAPVDADVDMVRSLGLPSTLCLTAGKDCLKHEAEAYTNNLKDAGVDVRVHEYPNAIHGFSHYKKGYEEEREDCWNRIRVFLGECLSRNGPQA